MRWERLGAGPGPFKLLRIVGTRPEAIKIAPLAIKARRRPELRHHILATGQQDALFEDALEGFGLCPGLRLPPVLHDRDPDVMTERLDAAIRPVIAADPPDIVLVQGDTTSAYAAARAAHALGVPVAHVEAGLRSHDFKQPWPEERNRVVIDQLATLLFAPTREAEANLVAERAVVTGAVVVTGNTGIGALLTMRAKLPAALPQDSRALILLTCHRRENSASVSDRSAMPSSRSSGAATSRSFARSTRTPGRRHRARPPVGSSCDPADRRAALS